jgi:hypothetical protein
MPRWQGLLLALLAFWGSSPGLAQSWKSLKPEQQGIL